MIARERINGLTLVPALAWQLADALAGSGGDVSSVDAVGYGGAAAAPDLAQVMRRTFPNALPGQRSEEHTSELQSLMRISYAVFCLKKKKNISNTNTTQHRQ